MLHGPPESGRDSISKSFVAYGHGRNFQKGKGIDLTTSSKTSRRGPIVLDAGGSQDDRHVHRIHHSTAEGAPDVVRARCSGRWIQRRSSRPQNPPQRRGRRRRPLRAALGRTPKTTAAGRAAERRELRTERRGRRRRPLRVALGAAEQNATDAEGDRCEPRSATDAEGDHCGPWGG